MKPTNHHSQRSTTPNRPPSTLKLTPNPPPLKPMNHPNHQSSKTQAKMLFYNQKKKKKNKGNDSVGGRRMGLMSEREDEGEVDVKLPLSAEGLAGTTMRPWVRDWDVVKSGWV